MRTDELIEQYENGERNFCEANLSGADLRWAYLHGACLSGADLSRADLRKADLRKADLRWATGNGTEIGSLNASEYIIVWTADDLVIGCEQHPIAEWWEFDDERISEMDDDAVGWWAKWKPILRQLVEMGC